MRLIDNDGRAAGWILGYPITRTAGCLRKRNAPPVNANPGVARCAGSVHLYSFGGHFAVVWLDGARAFYLDACGSLTACLCAPGATGFHTESRTLRQAQRPRVELVQAISFPFRQGYSGSSRLTPRHGIDRLLPNHYLDLGKWQLVRDSPKTAPLRGASTEDAIAEISMIVKRQIRAVVAHNAEASDADRGKGYADAACLRWAPGRSIGRGHCRNHDDEIAQIDCHSARQIGAWVASSTGYCRWWQLRRTISNS